jgi:hypothetical protein
VPHTHSADTKQTKNSSTPKQLAQISRIRKKYKYHNH